MTPAQLAAVAVVAASFGGGWWVGAKVTQGAHDAARVAEQEVQTKTAQIIAGRLAEMSTAQAKVTERVTHEVQTNTVYRECVLPDDGRRLLNDAINGVTPGGDGVQAPAE